MKTPAKKSGFTLIEIVIVLAIASLIMVIVFVAVAGAQRSRRDTTNKANANAYLAATEQYASNNAGTYPTAALATTFYNNKWADGTAYATGQVTAAATARTTAPTGNDVIYVSSNSRCNGAVMATNAGANNIAVMIYQENGGSYCIANN